MLEMFWAVLLAFYRWLETGNNILVFLVILMVLFVISMNKTTVDNSNRSLRRR